MCTKDKQRIAQLEDVVVDQSEQITILRDHLKRSREDYQEQVQLASELNRELIKAKQWAA